MTAKKIFSTALLLTAFSLGTARGQMPGNGRPNPLDADMPPQTPVNGLSTNGPQEPVVPAPSSFIRGDKYQCCDGVGGSGPLGYDLFTRIGPSAQIGRGTLADVLQTGLYLGGGGDLFFFNPAMTSAWTLELAVANISNHAHGAQNGIPYQAFVPLPASQNPTGTLPPVQVFFGRDPGVPGVTVQQVNRTYVDFGGGKEWYVYGSASCAGPAIRVGVDGGGRGGSESIRFHELPETSDTIGGLWVAVHGDLEWPLWGCCVLDVGFRIEYAYTFSDILQFQNSSDLQDLNLIFNIGVRF